MRIGIRSCGVGPIDRTSGLRPGGAEPRQGLTLLEALIGIVLLSVILLGAQSAVLVAGRAIPREGSATNRLASASRALDTIVEDVTYALSISVDSSTAFTITFADRDGDGVEETVRYSWTGTPGDPLLRQYNDSAAMAIATDVHTFSFILGRRAIPEPATYTEGPEVLLSEVGVGLTNLDARIQSGNWIAQYFKPAPPPGAVSWRVTRALFRAKIRGGTGGETAVQIRLPSGTVPSVSILEEFILYENTLASQYAWREIAFTDAHSIPASSGACLVFQWIKDSDACEIQYRSLSLGDSHMSQSSNKGVSWTATLTQNVIHAVYGRYMIADPPIYTYRWSDLRCTLAVGHPSQSLTATARVLNEPEIGGP